MREDCYKPRPTFSTMDTGPQLNVTPEAIVIETTNMTNYSIVMKYYESFIITVGILVQDNRLLQSCCTISKIKLPHTFRVIRPCYSLIKKHKSVLSNIYDAIQN